MNINYHGKEIMKTLGKTKLVSLMKSQFEYFTDLYASTSMFEYIRFDNNSERLRYCDDYDNIHDLYHSMVGGEEVLLYHVNDERNRRLEIPEGNKSVIQSLKNNQQKIEEQSEGNNLEHQRSQKER